LPYVLCGIIIVENLQWAVFALCRVHIWKSEAKPVVSRRKILESLEEGDAEDDEDEEQRTTKSSENSYDDEDGNDDDDRVFFSSSGDELSESGSFAEGGGGGEERFSRSFFLRSLPDGAGSQSRLAQWALTPPPPPPPYPPSSLLYVYAYAKVQVPQPLPLVLYPRRQSVGGQQWSHTFVAPPPFFPPPPHRHSLCQFRARLELALVKVRHKKSLLCRRCIICCNY
jgi:hypothetical protein